jgi:hypothetical protein
MADVYAQLYLTISASCSTADFSGCFAPEAARKALYLAPEVSSLGRYSVGNTSSLVFNKPNSAQLLYKRKGRPSVVGGEEVMQKCTL